MIKLTVGHHINRRRPHGGKPYKRITLARLRVKERALIEKERALRDRLRLSIERLKLLDDRPRRLVFLDDKGKR